jgi:hypothetical protein
MAYAGTQDPEFKRDFIVIGKTNEVTGWKKYNYSTEVTTDDSGILYVACGIWCTWEIERTYYIDLITVQSQKAGIASFYSLHKYNNADSLTYFTVDEIPNVVTSKWDFGDGTEVILPGPPKDISHKYTKWGWDDKDNNYLPYIVTLDVEYDDGTAEKSATCLSLYRPGDVTGDGRVNIIDVATIGLNWGKITGPPDYWQGDESADKADLNNDGRVNIIDTAIVGLNWGQTAW